MKNLFSATSQSVLDILPFLKIRIDHNGIRLIDEYEDTLERAYAIPELDRYLQTMHVKAYFPGHDTPEDAAYYAGQIRFKDCSFNTWYVDELGIYHAGLSESHKLVIDDYKFTAESITDIVLDANWEDIEDSMDSDIRSLAQAICFNPREQRSLLRAYLNLAPADLVI